METSRGHLYEPAFLTTFSKVSTSHLDTRFAKIDAKSVCILAVMFNQLLQRSESGATGDEKSAFVQLSDAIVFDSISIPNCNIQTHTYTHAQCM